MAKSRATFIEIAMIQLVAVLLIIASLIFVLRKFDGIMSILLNVIHNFYRSSSAFHALGRKFADYKLPKGLSPLTKIEKVSDRTYRILGLNPGSHTLQGTNTWLITDESTDAHILVDTGEEATSPQYLELLFDEVFPAIGTKRLSHILLTHGHGDHQGGVLPILAELRKRNMLPLPQIFKRSIQNGDFPAKGFDCMHIEENQEFRVGKGTTVAAVCTPGHTDDHVSFIIKEDNALLSGDCVLGCGTTVFDDLHEYMRSLQKIRQLILDSRKAGAAFHNIHSIYPGHGPVIREKALEKIDEYILHRSQREQQIHRALQDLSAERETWITSWSLVPIVYGDLTAILRVSAQRQITHHLLKLRKEGKVRARFPDEWTTCKNAK